MDNTFFSNRTIIKPDKKPFVVEIKNRRRQSRREHSIWGKIRNQVANAPRLEASPAQAEKTRR